MTLLKISVIASDAAALERVRGDIRPGPDTEVGSHLGDVQQLCIAIVQERPDLVVAELPRAGQRELGEIEAALASHPHTSLILLSLEPSPEFLLRAMQAGIREVVPLPLKNDEFREAFTRHYERLRAKQAGPAGGQVLAFMSAKGGCGATFLATSLAHALSLRDRRVAVIDLNLALGDAAIFLAEKPSTSTLADVCAQEHRLDAALVEAAMTGVGKQLWLLAAPEPERVAGVRADSVKRILALARSRFDFVILDVGCGLDGVTGCALDAADRIYIVAQASMPVVHKGKRLLRVLHELGYGPHKLELVVNRACKGGEISSGDLRGALQFDAAREIPNSYRSVATAIDHGLPLLAHAPKDPVARAISDWAEQLAPSPSSERPRAGWMRGLSLILQ